MKPPTITVMSDSITVGDEFKLLAPLQVRAEASTFSAKVGQCLDEGDRVTVLEARPTHPPPAPPTCRSHCLSLCFHSI